MSKIYWVSGYGELDEIYDWDDGVFEFRAQEISTAKYDSMVEFFNLSSFIKFPKVLDENPFLVLESYREGTFNKERCVDFVLLAESEEVAIEASKTYCLQLFPSTSDMNEDEDDWEQ